MGHIKQEIIVRCRQASLFPLTIPDETHHPREHAMSSYEENLRRQQQFLRKAESLISQSNREIIGPMIPEINEARVINFARAVAHLRGRYLQAAFNISNVADGEAPSDAEITNLRKYRDIYEEARKAYEELTHAIERGYIHISEKD